MMKKALITASLLIFATTAMCYAETTQTTVQKSQNQLERPAKPDFQRPPKGPDFEKRRTEFENRLKLTDEQKQQANEIHKKGFEQMKPVMEKMKQKQKELFDLKKAQKDNEKIEQLKKEIGALKRESHELRAQNMKEFEGILTKKQQKELQKMKEEGRKNFEKQHKNRPPMPPIEK